MKEISGFSIVMLVTLSSIEWFADLEKFAFFEVDYWAAAFPKDVLNELLKERLKFDLI